MKTTGIGMVLAIGLLVARPVSAELTEGRRLAAIYDIILQAKFAQARDTLARSCPPAPAVACQVIGVAATWWQIVLDPYARTLDQRFEREANAAIDAAEAWTRREPRRAEAWFYLAGSYAPLAQWQALRGENFAAARNGNRIRVALEKTIALDSTLIDAYFGIGMYHYWADVAPVAAKILRVFLLLPGGDREKGLQEMTRARDRGVLLGGEADFQLHWLYLWFEHDTARALDLVRSLDAKYPTNPVFQQRIAEIEHDYRHDHRASAAAWDVLLARAARESVELPRMTEARARIGLAQELVEMSEPQRAVDVLQPLAGAKVDSPYSSASLVQFVLGTAHAALKARDRAIAAFNSAIALAPKDDPYDVRKRSRDAIRKISSR